MKLSLTTCYSHLLFMLMHGDKFEQAVTSFKSSAPNFTGEGFNGYIEVSVEFEIKNLTVFAELFSAWYDSPRRSEFYADIKGKYVK